MARFGKINKRGATIVVAASDSQEKAGADFVCPSTAAIAYINSTVLPSVPSGGRVLFLEGSYEMTTTAEAISLTSSHNGFSFEGQGYGTNFYSKTGIGAIDHFFTANNADYISIENMRFTSNTGNSGDAIHLEGGSDYWKISNNYFTGPWTYTIYFVNGSSAIVTGNHFYHSAAAGTFIISDAGTNSVMSNNIFTNGVAGILLYNAASSRNVVMGNTFNGTTNGVGSTAANDLVISSNSFYNIGNTAISVTGTDCLIVGNAIKTCGANGIYAGAYSDVIGNRIEGAAQYGIFTTGNDVHVEGNKLRGSGTRQIYVNSATLTSILNNMLLVGSGAGTGIDMAATCTGPTIVRGNTIFQSVGNDLIDLGTNTIYYDLITDIFSDIVDEDTDYVVDNYSLNAAPPITCTISNQPDVPRNVTYTVTDAAGGDLAFSFTVTGVDMNGRTVTETFTGTGTTSGTGSRAYQSITSVIVTQNTNYGAGDVIDVGVGAVFGLSGQLTKTADVVQAKQNGVVITGGGVDYTVNATYHTVALTTVAANDDLSVLFRKCANTLTWT